MIIVVVVGSATGDPLLTDRMMLGQGRVVTQALVLGVDAYLRNTIALGFHH